MTWGVSTKILFQKVPKTVVDGPHIAINLPRQTDGPDGSSPVLYEFFLEMTKWKPSSSFALTITVSLCPLFIFFRLLDFGGKTGGAIKGGASNKRVKEGIFGIKKER
ncbi:hypothetical protein OPV22_007146 [Ensete ventricosum]|uniref:Uncharacterized protein n=1 Tax=Ensete ventricosum TaxID=4639 RepID=A0AAV8RGL7_ENSVE|nr:hypothetical protein OPV22_007146 [Ensete ventricosum]